MNKAAMFQEWNWPRNINFWKNKMLDFQSSHEINTNRKLPSYRTCAHRYSAPKTRFFMPESGAEGQWSARLKILKINDHKIPEVGEMVKWIRILTALPEDAGSIPSTHIMALICNSRSRGPNCLFWPLQAPGDSWCMDTSKQNIHVDKIRLCFN